MSCRSSSARLSSADGTRSASSGFIEVEGFPSCAILAPVVRLLFVCMGNICRSPTAEGVMRGLLREQGLEGAVEVDSAGTGGWHVGDPPDARAAAPAGSRARIQLLREFDPASDGAPDLDVPDPYYGGDDGFEHVLDLVDAACRGLIDELRADGRL